MLASFYSFSHIDHWKVVMPSNRALAKIRDYNCSASQGTSRHDTQVQPGRQTTQQEVRERVVVMCTTKVGVTEARVRTLIEISPLLPNEESVIMILTPVFQIQRTVDLKMGLHPRLLRPKFTELFRYQCRKAVVWSEVLSKVLSEVEGETDLEAAPFLLMKVGQRGREPAPFHMRLGEKVQLHVSLNVIGLGLTLKGSTCTCIKVTMNHYSGRDTLLNRS